MNREQSSMLSCLRAYLDKTEYFLPEDTDVKALYDLSRAHNLSPIVFSVIKNDKALMSDMAVRKAFEDDFFDSIVRYDCQKNIISSLSNLFDKHGVAHVFFKGSEIKEYYPVPELRSMGDVDVLIDIKDRDRVKSLLLSDGYTLSEHNGPVYNYNKNGVLIEMHTSIVNGKVGSKNAEEYYKNAFSKAVFNGNSGRFDETYHLAYLVVHIAHHFWFYGAGAKMILDLAVMLKHFDISLDNVFYILKNIGLDDFARVIFSVCFKWFGVGKSYTDDILKTEEFLLSFGAFGNVNRNVGVVVRRKAIEEGKKSTFGAKLSLVFPPYSKMKNIPYMKFMEGRPYLLIWGWMYRLFYNLKYRKQFAVSASLDMAGDDAKIKAQKEIDYFEEIGLI